MDETATARAWPNVFTPSTLADWWKCSERHVRNLIEQGDLPAFRLGGKLLRIRPEAVEAFERQVAIISSGTAEAPAKRERAKRLDSGPLVRARIKALR